MAVTRRHEKVQFLIGVVSPRDLEAISDLELDKLYHQEMQNQDKVNKDTEERADELRFFNQPEAQADFNVWCKLKSWKVEETTALFLGKDPSKVSWFGIQRLVKESPFARRFDKIRGQLNRAIDDGALKQRDTPAAFVAWAESVKLSIPSDIKLRIGAVETATDEGIEGRERRSLVTLILMMAKKHYGYEIAASKSLAPKQIADDMDREGFKLGAETIRKYLREAANLVERKSD